MQWLLCELGPQRTAGVSRGGCRGLLRFGLRLRRGDRLLAGTGGLPGFRLRAARRLVSMHLIGAWFQTPSAALPPASHQKMRRTGTVVT